MPESLDKSKPIVLAITGASGAVYGFSLLKFFLDSAYKVDLVLSANALKVAKQELDLELEGCDLTTTKQRIINYLFNDKRSPVNNQTASVNVQTSLSSRIEEKKRELQRKKELKSGYKSNLSYNLSNEKFTTTNSNTVDRSPFTDNLTLWSPENVAASISSGSYKTQGMIIAPCSMGTIANIAAGTSNNLVARAADVTLKERRKLVLLARETPLSTIHLRNMLTLSELGTIVVPAAPGFYHKPQTMQDQINFVLGKALDVFGIENEMFLRWNPQATPALV
jgi:4-hydroxy-3-polyprenylbenzoate decarboxylase